MAYAESSDILVTDYEGDVQASQGWTSNENTAVMADGVGENGSKAVKTTVDYHKGWDWDYGTEFSIVSGDMPGRGENTYLTFWYSSNKAITIQLYLCDPNWGTDYIKAVDLAAGEGYFSIDITDCAFETYRIPQIKIHGNKFSEAVVAELTDGDQIVSAFDNFSYTAEAPGAKSAPAEAPAEKEPEIEEAANIWQSFDANKVYYAAVYADDANVELSEEKAETGKSIKITMEYDVMREWNHGVRLHLNGDDNSVLHPVDPENKYLTFWADTETPVTIVVAACDPNWGKDKEYEIDLMPGAHFYSVDLTESGFEKIRNPHVFLFDNWFSDAVIEQLPEKANLTVYFDSFMVTDTDMSN